MENEDNGAGLAQAVLLLGMQMIGAAIQDARSAKRQEEQNAFAERMAATSFDRSMQAFWDTQSIQSKVSQARDSGVNPASLFGSLASGSVPSTPMAAPSSTLPVVDLVSMFTNLIMRNKELDIEKMIGLSQIRKNNADAAKAESETKTIDLERDFIPALRNGQIDVLNQQFDLMREEIETERTKQALNNSGVSVNEAKAALDLVQKEIQEGTKQYQIDMANALSRSANAKAEFDEAKAKYADKFARADLNVLTSQATLNYANANQVKQFCTQYFENRDMRGRSLFQNLTQSQINELQSCMELNDARTGLTWKQGKEVDKTIEKITHEIGKIDAEAALTTMDVKWYVFDSFNQALNTTAHLVDSFVPDVNVNTTTTTTTKGKGVTTSTSSSRGFRGKRF